MCAAAHAQRPGVGRVGDGGPDFYSVSQLAALLGVSRMTVWRWISAGELVVSKLGHRTSRIRRSDLDAFLGRHTPAHVRPRQPPVVDMGELASSGHVVQFYETDPALLEVVGAVLTAGLRAGDAAVVLATPEHRRGLERQISAMGVGDVAAESLIMLDAASTLAEFMVDGSPDANKFEVVIGGVLAQAGRQGRHVRAFGEMVALLLDEGNAAAAVRLEGLWNNLQAHIGTFSLICAYPMADFAERGRGEVMHQVCGEHSRVIPAESYTRLESTEERMRAIALLQQKAQALETETTLRRLAEDRLRAVQAAD